MQQDNDIWQYVVLPSEQYNKVVRQQKIKMQFWFLHFKQPHILCTLDELSRSNSTTKVHPKCVKCFKVFEMQIRELHFYLLTPLVLYQVGNCIGNWPYGCEIRVL